MERTVTERPAMGRSAWSTKGPILAGLLLLLSVSYFGCGVKGPPVPPRQPPVPPVVDLAYTVADQTIVLTWRLPGPLSAGQANHAAFGLYRSRSTLAKSGCDGCPLIFEKVTTILFDHTEPNRFSIDAPLEPGYRYMFKVRLETDAGNGPDSNTVQFDHLPDMPSGRSVTP